MKKRTEFKEFSHLDKVIYPQKNFLKGDVITYYKKISSIMLSYLHHHPIVMHRFPNGIGEAGFFQKQISEYFPSWFSQITIPLKKGGKQTLAAPENKNDLLYLANQNCLELHAWMSSTKNIYKPDKIVFDLDPDNTPLQKLRKVAKIIQASLQHLKLNSFVMTTGSRGYHVVVPIKAEHTFESVHEFAKTIAQQIAQQYPRLCTASATKNRKGKVFIDYLRNSYGQTSITPYSLRARPGAPVATPISWSELNKTAPQKYTLKNVFRRIAQFNDPWKDFYKQAKPLPPKIDAIFIKNKKETI